MMANELKHAMLDKCPVIVNRKQKSPHDNYDFKCECVTAIIYRIVSGKIQVSAEVKNGNSRHIVLPENLRRVE